MTQRDYMTRLLDDELMNCLDALMTYSQGCECEDVAHWGERLRDLVSHARNERNLIIRLTPRS